MCDSFTDGDAESVQDHLSDYEEGRSKNDVSNRPPVVQRANDEDELKYDVNEDTGSVKYEFNYPESDGRGGGERGEVLERCYGDEPRDEEHC